MLCNKLTMSVVCNKCLFCLFLGLQVSSSSGIRSVLSASHSPSWTSSHWGLVFLVGERQECTDAGRADLLLVHKASIPLTKAGQQPSPTSMEQKAFCLQQKAQEGCMQKGADLKRVDTTHPSNKQIKSLVTILPLEVFFLKACLVMVQMFLMAKKVGVLKRKHKWTN